MKVKVHKENKGSFLHDLVISNVSRWFATFDWSKTHTRNVSEDLNTLGCILTSEAATAIHGILQASLRVCLAHVLERVLFRIPRSWSWDWFLQSGQIRTRSDVRRISQSLCSAAADYFDELPLQVCDVFSPHQNHSALQTSFVYTPAILTDFLESPRRSLQQSLLGLLYSSCLPKMSWTSLPENTRSITRMTQSKHSSSEKGGQWSFKMRRVGLGSTNYIRRVSWQV